MSVARSIRPLLAVTALSVLALTSCGGDGGADSADGAGGGAAEQSQGSGSEGDSGSGGDPGSENGSGGGEAYEVVSEHELIDMIAQSERETDPDEVCVSQAYDQVTADFIADFIDPAVDSVDDHVYGSGNAECSIFATDSEGEPVTILSAGFYLQWNGAGGLPNVNCEDGKVDEEFILDEWVGGDQYTETAELIEDESTDAVYLYDPEGSAQMGLLCNADGSAIMVEIFADEEESSQSMIEKVRTEGQLAPVMQNFAARIDGVNEHFDAIDQAAESQR